MRQTQQVVEMLKGTFFEELLTIGFGSNVYLDPGDEVNKDAGELVIGIMTPLEKLFYTMINQRQDAIIAVCEACRDNSNGNYNYEYADSKCYKARDARKEISLLSGIMWFLIKSRLDIRTSIGIRKDFQIVSLRNEIVRAGADDLSGIQALDGLLVRQILNRP